MESLHSLGSTDLWSSHRDQRHKKHLARFYSRDDGFRMNPPSRQAECRDHTGTDVVVARRESFDRLWARKALQSSSQFAEEAEQVSCN